jgi:SAM-dependent methyltransferase
MPPVTAKARRRFRRDHGALFDASALAYDRFRPGYPEVIIDEMVLLSRLGPGSRLLEVGCGTGQATAALARREFRMDCVDPGKNLISVAREKCRAWPQVRFREARFEDFALELGAYDLVFSAQAFHWVAPSVRLRKAAGLLQAGGSLALLCNYPGRPHDEALERLSKLIQRESGGMLAAWNYEDEVRGWVSEINESGLFQQPSVCRHSWHQRYSADQYVGLFRTYSDFLSLPTALQQRITVRIHRFIAKHGGHVCRPYDCLLIHARKAGPPDP